MYFVPSTELNLDGSKLIELMQYKLSKFNLCFLMIVYCIFLLNLSLSQKILWKAKDICTKWVPEVPETEYRTELQRNINPNFPTVKCYL